MKREDTFLHEVKCDLTESDRAEIAGRIAGYYGDLDRARGRLDAAKAAYKKVEKAVETDLAVAVTAIRQGFEHREIRVYKRPNFELERMEFVSFGTGRVVDHRELKPDERQTEIELGPDPEPAAKPGVWILLERRLVNSWGVLGPHERFWLPDGAPADDGTVTVKVGDNEAQIAHDDYEIVEPPDTEAARPHRICLTSDLRAEPELGLVDGAEFETKAVGREPTSVIVEVGEPARWFEIDELHYLAADRLLTEGDGPPDEPEQLEQWARLRQDLEFAGESYRAGEVFKVVTLGEDGAVTAQVEEGVGLALDGEECELFGHAEPDSPIDPPVWLHALRGRRRRGGRYKKGQLVKLVRACGPANTQRLVFDGAANQFGSCHDFARAKPTADEIAGFEVAP